MKPIERDQDGYLKHLSDWSEALAEELAQEEGLELSADHWEIIWFVRGFYKTYQTSPAIRALLKALKPALGETKANSLYLQKLFPKGPAKQVTKIAGLPKPAKCL